MRRELTLRADTRLMTREQRQRSRDIAAAQVPAKLATARIQAASLAAHVGLVCTEILTSMEVQAVQRQGAMMDARARAIVDAYCGLVTTELTKLSLEE